MIRHGIDEAERFLFSHALFNDAAGEGLRDGVCGDEAKAAEFTFLLQKNPRRLIPEVHDEIRTARNVRTCGPAGLRVTISQFLPHILAANEGRIADDEFYFRPLACTRVHIFELLDLRVRVWNFLAREGVPFFRHPIPAGKRFAIGIAQHFDSVVMQDGVLVNDGAIGMQDGIADGFDAHGSYLPFQIANPQDKISNWHGPLIDFQSIELTRVDRFALEHQPRFFLAEAFRRFQHFAFQPLHQFQRHIEEVARAAGGVQHAGGAELAVEAFDSFKSFCRIFLAQRFDQYFHLFPISAQRLDDGGDDDAFHIGARGVMRAKLRTLRRIERAFEQGAENGGFDIGPVFGGSDVEFGDFIEFKFQGFSCLE